MEYMLHPSLFLCKDVNILLKNQISVIIKT